jgi:hypothetical protein
MTALPWMEEKPSGNAPLRPVGQVGQTVIQGTCVLVRVHLSLPFPFLPLSLLSPSLTPSPPPCESAVLNHFAI